MTDQKPTLEYANKSAPGDSRPARTLIVLVLFLLLVIIVTAPFWWGRLEQLIDPTADDIIDFQSV